MELRTEFFLAWRYLKPKRNAISVITCISLLGVALGVTVLFVVLSVMTGMTDRIKERLAESSSHIKVSPTDAATLENPGDFIRTAKELGFTAIPIVSHPALIQKDDVFVPKNIIASEPDSDALSKLSSKILAGPPDIKSGEIILSYPAYRELMPKIGDKILIHSPNKLTKMIRKKEGGGFEAEKKQELYLPSEFKVSGVSALGYYRFSQDALFMSIDDATELFGMPLGSATNIYVWLDKPFEADNAIAKLKERHKNYRYESWMQMNGDVLNVLAVEKNMMFFLLIFIVLVAAFSNTTTLITMVMKKTREIGVLKSIGASSGAVLRIFLMQGFMVGVLGTLLGNLLGIAVILSRNEIAKVLSSITQIAFLKNLPAHILPSDVLWVSLCSILLCTVCGLIPAWRAAKLDPARALRYE